MPLWGAGKALMVIWRCHVQTVLAMTESLALAATVHAINANTAALKLG
jgi:hypothetical protein